MDGELTGDFTSGITFISPDGKSIFIINKDGCYVPEGVSVDESAKAVIDALDIYIKQIVEPLEKENAELKAKIADGIRVYASKDRQGYAVINHFGKGPRNATLLLDKGE